MLPGHYEDGRSVESRKELAQRWLSGGLISLLGVLTLTIPLFDIWEDTTQLSWSLTASLAENSLLIILSLGLVGAGVWLARKTWAPRHHLTAVKWSYLIIGGVAVLYAIVIGTQLRFAHDLKPFILVGDGMLFVAVTAVFVGVMAARRQQSTEALRTSEERHRTIIDDVLDTSEVATFVLDDNFSVIWINEATERYFGIDREDVVGTDKRTLIENGIADIFEDPERFEERVTAAYEDNTYRENFECHVLPGEDREERRLEHWSQPIESGLYEGGRIEHYTDITEQREHEAELRDAKEQLEAAALAGAVGTWEWHVPEDEMVVGPSFARLFGVDPEVASEGVSVEAFIDAIHEDDRDHVERKIDEALESCGEYETEYRVWNEDDELRWVLARGHVECDDEGNPVTFPGALTDITEQKRAQTELEEREENLREMYDLISDSARSFDAKVDGLISIGRDLFGAEYGAFARIDAGSNEYELEVVQAESLDLRVGDVIPYTQTHCQRMVAANRTVQFETRPFESAPDPTDDVGGFEFGSSDEETGNPPRDYGTDEEFEMYVGTPVSIGDEVYGALCFLDREEVEGFEDWQLTLLELMGSWVGYELDRKQLLEERERRLRESEARFESIVDTVDEYAIFTVDAEGNVQNWNEGAEEILGYERDDVVGAPVTALSTAENEAGTEDILGRVREEGRVAYDGWRTRKDGSQFYADVTISARYDENDELAGYTVIIRDTTERRAYQETIEHERERLEFMNRFVRHNILNGLNLINARAGLLQDSVAGDGDAQEHLELIQNRVTDMSKLVDTMRTFMDAVLTDSDHELRRMPLREELERKVELARESYDAEFDVHGLPSETAHAEVDDLVGEVFENVLSNAVVHNDSETPQVEVWATRDTRELPANGQVLQGGVVGPGAETEERKVLTVHVADNGPGISDDGKAAVLEKGSSRFSEPGHGFGLYLVREMMDTYGGSIDIRDNQPRGTVFDLTFPLTEAEDGGDDEDD